MRVRGQPDAPFFIGWGKKIAPPLLRFLAVVTAGFLLASAGFALATRLSFTDPGDGHRAGATGREGVVGRLEYKPYPVLRLPAKDGEPAQTLMLSGQGKRGAPGTDALEDGAMVNVRGGIVERGDIRMIEAGRIEAADAPSFDAAEPVPLGRWRLTGEICDGKCWTGVMRPGRGLAHKACANLCVFGGAPAVFVATDEVAGSEFFLLADAAGEPLDQETLSRFMALMIEAEGAVERLDNLNVFRMDVETVRVLR